MAEDGSRTLSNSDAPWDIARAALGAGDYATAGAHFEALSLVADGSARGQALAALALCQTIQIFDQVSVDLEAAQARARAIRYSERGRLAAGLHALVFAGADEALAVGEDACSFIIPFRLGIVEVSLPFALRPPPRQVRVRCLGTFEVEIDGTVVGPWRNQRARLVLAYLIAHRREPVSRQLLMGTFWPEHSEERAENNLSLAVMTARRLIDGRRAGPAESLIRSAAGAYTVDGGADAWVDSEAFVAAVTDGKRLEGLGLDEAAAAAFDDAIALYGGDFLPGDLYQDWTIERRQGLGDLYDDILRRRARLARAAGDLDLSIQVTRRTLDRDPCSEEAHRQLMLDYLSTGQRGRALRQMDLCRESLARSLGVGPEAETLAVYSRIVGNQSPG